MVRRYKPPRKPRKQRRAWKQLSVDYTPNSQRWMDDHSEQYPSREPIKCATGKVSRIEYEGSYTVAPAYNKGAYQVIPASDIEYIGR